MSLSQIFLVSTISFGVLSAIYTPSENVNQKPLAAMGIKTIGWQTESSTPKTIIMHHNYSKVNRNTVQHSSDNRGGKMLEQHIDEFPSQHVEDFEAQQTEDVEQFTSHVNQATNFNQNGGRPSPNPYSTSKSVPIQGNLYNQHLVEEDEFKSPKKYRQPQRAHQNFYSGKYQGGPSAQIQTYSKCPSGLTGQFVYDLSCNQFLNCWNGRGYAQNCAPGTLFNPKTLECDFSSKVQCVSGPKSEALKIESFGGELQAACPHGFSGVIPHYTECNKFINCANGVENVMDCAPGTLFDVKTNLCDFPYKAECVTQGFATQRPTGQSHDSRLHNGFTTSFDNKHDSSNVNRQFITAYQQGENGGHIYNNEGHSSSYTILQNNRPILKTKPVIGSYGTYGVQGPDLSNPDDSFGQHNTPEQIGGTYSTGSNSPTYGQGQGFTQNPGSYSAGNRDRPLQSGAQNGVSYQPAYIGSSQGTTYQTGTAQDAGNFDSSSYQAGFSKTRPSYGSGHVEDDGTYHAGTAQDGSEYASRPSQGTSSYKAGFSKNRPPSYGRGPVQDDGSYHAENVGITSSQGTSYQAGSTHNAGAYQTGFATRPSSQGFSMIRPPSHGSGTGTSQDGSSYSNKPTQGTSYQAGFTQNRPIDGTNPNSQTVYSNQETGSTRQHIQGGQRENNYGYQTHDQTQYSSQQNYAQTTGTNGIPRCPQGVNGLQPHPNSCTKFLNCPTGHIQDCAPGTHFNIAIGGCDFPHQAKCTRGPGTTNWQTTNNEERNNEQLNVATTVRTPPGFQSHRPKPPQWSNNQYDDDNIQEKDGPFFDPANDLNTAQTQNLATKQDGGISSQWPPQFPSSDPNADYFFEYDIVEDLVKSPASNLGKDWCDYKGFECGNKICLSPSNVCDGKKDCTNGKDEDKCAIYLSGFSLTPHAILAVREIEKQLNVTLASCAKFCMESKRFECKSFNFRKQDGTCYLLNNNVGTTGALMISEHNDYYECRKHAIDCKNMYTCKNKRCIDMKQLCDGLNDCGDGLDEKNCKASDFGYKISLAGSPKDNEGRILVQAFGKQGYICDDMFGLSNADVVCRELGFDLGALEVKPNSHFAQNVSDNGTFYMMDDVKCLGNETSLRDCDFSGWGVHNCASQEIVGVVCKVRQADCPKGHWQCKNEQECLPLAFVCDGVFDCSDKSDELDNDCNAPIQIRLANGFSRKDGRVEIKYHGTWGTICDDDFNDDAAKVVCSQMGFPGSAAVRKDSYYGPGEGPIWLDQVFCQGNESVLQDCVHWDWGEHNCEHTEDVGVICDNSENEGKPRNSKTLENEKIALLPSKCGLRSDSMFAEDSDVHFRVVSGSKAKPGDYPWQASIRVKGKSKSSHWCGAVVISKNFVVTAAHCLVGYSKGAYFIVAGDYNVDNTEGSEQEVYIEDFLIHEEFRSGNKMNNDIAIVRLKGNGFNLTKDVQPICLPDLDTDYAQDLNCTISGFGSIQSGKATASHDLRAGWIPIQSPQVCKMPHVYGSSISENMICAGSLTEGVDACDGDSGGPLACLNQGVFTLYGITSWGHHCGHANKPGVYVKVAKYRDWIENSMKKLSK